MEHVMLNKLVRGSVVITLVGVLSVPVTALAATTDVQDSGASQSVTEQVAASTAGDFGIQKGKTYTATVTWGSTSSQGAMIAKNMQNTVTITRIGDTYYLDVTPNDQGERFITAATSDPNSKDEEDCNGVVVSDEGASLTTYRVPYSSLTGRQYIGFYVWVMGHVTNTSYFEIDPSSVTEVQQPAAETVEMYRLYNPYTGEHFYTSDAEERDGLIEVGWNDEGVGWTAPSEGAPVYRLYNSYAPGGEHHYTKDAAERDSLEEAGWTYEGVAFYSADENDPNKVTVYREYNPNAYSCNHNYTADKSEHDGLIEVGWNDEGIGWYGVADDE